ncbi:MAG: hypothetical protein HDR19_07735 [Lachnospiraceae bacterium]|nr:hypothetical protein [Lachnospiraceae bacterium]
MSYSVPILDFTIVKAFMQVRNLEKLYYFHAFLEKKPLFLGILRVLGSKKNFKKFLNFQKNH